MSTSSYWMESTRLPKFARLDRNLTADVGIVGAGITGITAAYLLKRAGHSVVLLDRGRCAAVDTGHTTAHLTCVTDQRLHRLVAHFGRKRAQATWEAGAAAIDQIAANVRTEEMDAEFEWVPGYLYAAIERNDEPERRSLQKDAALANELGFRAEFMSSIPPLGLPGVKFFH